MKELVKAVSNLNEEHNHILQDKVNFSLNKILLVELWAAVDLDFEESKRLEVVNRVFAD